MNSKEIVKNKILGLEDDYQHYTMVDKDKAKAHFIKLDIEEHQLILKDLEYLDSLKKFFSDSHICEIKARFNEIECSSDKCDNCPLGFESGICLKNTFKKKWELQKENQDLKVFVDAYANARDELLIRNQNLEKENQELRRKYESHDFLYQNEVSKNGTLAGKIFEKDLIIQKLTKVIEIIKSKKVDMRYFLECVGVDTYNFWATKEGAGALTQQEHDLLNEVLLCK